MTRLIDAEEIKKKAVPHTRGEFGYSADIRKWAVLVADIDDAPAIDAIPVVRCRNCKHSSVYYNGLINSVVCVCKAGRVVSVPLDGYCYRGEAKPTVISCTDAHGTKMREGNGNGSDVSGI